MTYTINETHDPNLRSWVESANDPNTEFPIQNLPFCLFRPPRLARRRNEGLPRLGVGIGDRIFDVYEALKENLLDDAAERANELSMLSSLNFLMGLDREQWSELRWRTSELLRSDNTEVQGNQELTDKLLAPISECELLL